MHLAWFLLTLITTTWVGTGLGPDAPWSVLIRALPSGLWYSLPILIILGCHEFGHYVYCRKHDVDATLPYFLPAPPFLLTGTFGAVIRIRQAFPSKKALFDIGVAGPIAGFVALVPFLYWGITLSTVAPIPPHAIYFGEPLLYKAFAHLQFGPVPAGKDVFLHPMAFAAWFGMLATAWNLLPFGQLDGGHLTYATLGDSSRYFSLVTVAGAVVMTFVSYSWAAMTLMMVAMLFFLGPRHPRVIYESEPLAPGRVALAIFAIAMFVLCFTPVPIDVLK